MSDYIYTSRSEQAKELSASVKKIYQAYEIECQEFSGPWGSLSVSPSPYVGLQPYEDKGHICVVLGGPVFYFRNNDFLTGSNPTEGTQALLKRYLSGKLDLVNDVSGPFQLLIVDKTNSTVTCITDLMLFIPAYVHENGNNEITFGSHVDAVARVTGQVEKLDKASVADFLLHGVVTYPYTVFSGLRQMHPATKYSFSVNNNELTNKEVHPPYWLPYEEINYPSLSGAAHSLREGVANHVNTITKSMAHVAQFISGGEDSRSLLGLMPEGVKRDGYIFLDSLNREGKIAQKVANSYGANFKMGQRDPLHYLHIVKEANALVGSGHQYLHCHSLRFDQQFKLNDYSAVFGGYLSDSLLKGAYANKSPLRNRLNFLPQRCIKGETRSTPIKSDLFTQDVVNKINNRRRKHVERVRKIRPESSHEWFVLWPATMRLTIPNHYCNRRLFASYEVFMSHEVVRISAGVPTEWKLNRKLFHSAFQPCLAKSKWIRHSDGRLPYFGSLMNTPVFIVKFVERILHKLKIKRIDEGNGPWNSWKKCFAQKEWQMYTKENNKELQNQGLLKDRTIDFDDKKSLNLLSLKLKEDTAPIKLHKK